MNEFKITTRSVKETIELAQNIESEKFPGMVICLNGELGSGKTVFAKGFAQAMGIEEISSPTFNIIKEYEGELTLYHMDVYRVEDKIENLGLDEYFYGAGVSLVEWADLIKDNLPEERLDIKISLVDENTRIIKLQPYGSKYESICEDII